MRSVSTSFDRLVLDSPSVYEMYWGEKDGLRKYLNKLVDRLKNLDATAVVTSEISERSGKLTRFGVAEFIVDGVIRLEGFALGDTTYRSAQVVKMRRTPIRGEILKVEMGDQGISVKPEEKA